MREDAELAKRKQVGVRRRRWLRRELRCGVSRETVRLGIAALQSGSRSSPHIGTAGGRCGPTKISRDGHARLCAAARNVPRRVHSLSRRVHSASRCVYSGFRPRAQSVPARVQRVPSTCTACHGACAAGSSRVRSPSRCLRAQSNPRIGAPAAPSRPPVGTDAAAAILFADPLQALGARTPVATSWERREMATRSW